MVTDWQIGSYSIVRYRSGGTEFKACGDVVSPLDFYVPNTADADGTDSNSEYGTDEKVEDTATVQIIRQLKIENRDRHLIGDDLLVLKGKKADVLLFNTGDEPLVITNIEKGG